MALTLQNYQEEAYNNVLNHFQEGDRSIVVFPTGCGKSFVALKLMEDNRDSRILFLCPVTPIENQMYEYIIKYLSTEETDEKIRIEEKRKKRSLGIGEKAKIILPNLKVVLYPTMISKSKKTQVLLDKLKPDFIICDEVHHISTSKPGDETQETEEERTRDIKIQENIWEEQWLIL